MPSREWNENRHRWQDACFHWLPFSQALMAAFEEVRSASSPKKWRWLKKKCTGSLWKPWLTIQILTLVDFMYAFPLEPILGAKHKFANIAKTNTLIDVCTFTPASNDSWGCVCVGTYQQKQLQISSSPHSFTCCILQHSELRISWLFWKQTKLFASKLTKAEVQVDYKL